MGLQHTLTHTRTHVPSRNQQQHKMGLMGSKNRYKLPDTACQVMLIMTVPKTLEARADALWKLHAAWVKKTHPRCGDKKLLFYQVDKSAEIDDPTKGPNASKTGKVVFTVVEYYASKEGLDNHFAMFGAGHECGEFVTEFMALMKAGADLKGFTYGSPFLSLAPCDLPAKYDGFKA